MKIPLTFIDKFMDHIAVRCPRCASRAVFEVGPDANERRLVCPSCALTRHWRQSESVPLPQWSFGPHVAGYELDLWLQTPCYQQTLWAYDERHISFMEDLVAARQRVAPGYFNSALDARLPRWIVLAKHRHGVLRALARLRAMAQR